MGGFIAGAQGLLEYSPEGSGHVERPVCDSSHLSALVMAFMVPSRAEWA